MHPKLAFYAASTKCLVLNMAFNHRAILTSPLAAVKKGLKAQL
jgi:hypothetical protein